MLHRALIASKQMLIFCACIGYAPGVPTHAYSSARASSTLLRADIRADGPPPRQPVLAAKSSLFAAIEAFDLARTEGGGAVVDFGVKGGELDRSSGAPVNLAADGGFYRISEALGRAADEVVASIHTLAELNPTPDATRFFGTAEGKLSPLDGSWVNIFTTAADATFSSDSKRGDARASNTVDATRGQVSFCAVQAKSRRTVYHLSPRCRSLTAPPPHLTSL